MKFNKWTLGLAAIGAVSLASAARADEAKLSQLNTAISNTTISGYVDVAAQYNLGDAGGNTTPVTANGGPGVIDGFALNAVNITLDKPLDESPWASGYHIDFNAGQSALNATIGSSAGVRQAYVTLRTPLGNGIDWKFGAFDGITGYEGNTGYANPNYTRSYAYAVNPASQVGLLGSYKICDAATVQGGIVNFDVPTTGDTALGKSEKGFVGSVALTAPDSWGWFKGSTLNLGFVNAFNSSAYNNYSAGLTFNTPVAGLKAGIAFDRVQETDPTDKQEDGSIYGLYATFQQTDKLSYNLRAEYMAPDSEKGSVGDGPGRGEEVTFTVQYDLWANVITRVEGRWDHSEHSFNAFNNNNTENAFLLAVNAVYKF